MQERQCAYAPLSTRAIALDYLELHVRSKICLSEIRSFLLLMREKFLMYDKLG